MFRAKQVALTETTNTSVVSLQIVLTSVVQNALVHVSCPHSRHKAVS